MTTTAALPPQLTIKVDHAVTQPIFDEMRIRERALHVRSVDWACREIAELGESIASWRHPYGAEEVLRLSGALVYVRIEGGTLVAHMAAGEREVLDGVEAELRAAMPALEVDETRQEAHVSFWTNGPDGPWRTVRAISVPRWAEIEDNYGRGTGRRIADLVHLDGRPDGGQLVLLHGPPGTGKTHAVRALAWEWREWCELHYIVDPEILLGRESHYLMHVLLGAGSSEFDDPEALPQGGPTSDRWRVIVLEDSGELLASDAKSTTGQALSRLLNVVDGLIGQGLRVLVLITTNEEIRSLHPAVSRSGRCLADVRFEPLGVDDAAAWLRSRGLNARPDRPTALADLYALAAGRQGPRPERPIGFAAA